MRVEKSVMRFAINYTNTSAFEAEIPMNRVLFAFTTETFLKLSSLVIIFATKRKLTTGTLLPLPPPIASSTTFVKCFFPKICSVGALHKGWGILFSSFAILERSSLLKCL